MNASLETECKDVLPTLPESWCLFPDGSCVVKARVLTCVEGMNLPLLEQAIREQRLYQQESGQRPVESKPRPPSTTFPPGQMLELLQRRCRSIPQVTAFVWRDEGGQPRAPEAGRGGSGPRDPGEFQNVPVSKPGGVTELCVHVAVPAEARRGLPEQTACLAERPQDRRVSQNSGLRA